MRQLPHRNAFGQIIVEYVLILVVAVTIALALVKTLVHRDPNDPGLLIQAWSKMLSAIGSDYADDPKQP